MLHSSIAELVAFVSLSLHFPFRSLPSLPPHFLPLYLHFLLFPFPFITEYDPLTVLYRLRKLVWIFFSQSLFTDSLFIYCLSRALSLRYSCSPFSPPLSLLLSSTLIPSFPFFAPHFSCSPFFASIFFPLHSPPTAGLCIPRIVSFNCPRSL